MSRFRACGYAHRLRRRQRFCSRRVDSTGLRRQFYQGIRHNDSLRPLLYRSGRIRVRFAEAKGQRLEPAIQTRTSCQTAYPVTSRLRGYFVGNVLGSSKPIHAPERALERCRWRAKISSRSRWFQSFGWRRRFGGSRAMMFRIPATQFFAKFRIRVIKTLSLGDRLMCGRRWGGRCHLPQPFAPKGYERARHRTTLESLTSIHGVIQSAYRPTGTLAASMSRRSLAQTAKNSLNRPIDSYFPRRLSHRDTNRREDTSRQSSGTAFTASRNSPVRILVIRYSVTTDSCKHAWNRSHTRCGLGQNTFRIADRLVVIVLPSASPVCTRPAFLYPRSAYRRTDDKKIAPESGIEIDKSTICD